MNIPSSSSYFPSTQPVASALPAPAGLEPAERKTQALPPVEQASAAVRSGQRPSETPEQRADAARRASERQQQDEQRQLNQQLASRDREVRAHEQAHAAVGGQYAGAPRFQYQRGPDGQRYAVGGEVSIDTGEVPGDPEATLQKALLIQRAALAPAQPSPADRAIASQASAMAARARAALAAAGPEAGDALPGRQFDTLA